MDNNSNDNNKINWNSVVKKTGGFFSNLVSKANKSTNSETAKKIRKNLLVWGGVGLGFGIVLFLAGFITCVADGFSSVSSMDFGIPAGFIAGIVLSAVGVILIPIGGIAIKAGFAIVVTGMTAKFIDNNKYCKICGDRIEGNEMFCNSCGANLRENKLCKACGTQNELDDKFCRKCGKQLI